MTFVIGTTAGGTGAHVRMLAPGLADRGVGVTVVAPRRTGADLELDGIPGTTFTAVEFGDRPRPADAAAIVRLRRLLTSSVTRPDVVHAHGMRAGALTAIALAGVSARNPKLVVTVHNAPPDGKATRLVYLALERIVARRAALVLVVSPDLGERMRAVGAREVGRAVVPAPPRVPAAETTVDQPASEDRPLILAVGRLAPQKGFRTLIDAAQAWQHLTPRPRLLIVGDGPLRELLKSRAVQFGIDAEFPGHRSDIPALLATASVFVMPSLWEGQPLALQEALRAGVPIVASDVGGIPALTATNANGGAHAAILVKPGDPKALAQAVLSVLNDEALSATLRNAAIARARTLPTEDDAVTAALAAYARVLP